LPEKQVKEMRMNGKEEKGKKQKIRRKRRKNE
jgi:hypothetical protein